jgi:hypothetical protein
MSKDLRLEVQDGLEIKIREARHGDLEATIKRKGRLEARRRWMEGGWKQDQWTPAMAVPTFGGGESFSSLILTQLHE